MRDDADLEMSLSDWVIDHPEAARVLEGFGIDYCCGGRSLGYACRERGLDPHAVLERLRQAGLECGESAGGAC